MIDSYGRNITYLRLSVTDRCNLRCVYCMDEEAELLAHSDILRIEELARLARSFIRLGIDKLRITGGEPLVRKGIMELLAQLGEDVASGALSELTMTTNGLLLAGMAERLRAAGMRRINVSLDTLDPNLFRRITRWGEVEQVLDGIQAAKEAGLRVKINTVLLKGINDDKIDALIAWAGARGHDLTLIEAMPLGCMVGRHAEQFLSITDMRETLSARWTLLPSHRPTNGPADYVTVAETGGTLGFIAPLSHGFCGDCNRLRVTSTGNMTLCLGQDKGVDLGSVIRATNDDGPLEQAILAGVALKPRGHHFTVGLPPSALPISPHNRMNRTGG
jgi:cyclic pyranopterin phosphate synthase